MLHIKVPQPVSKKQLLILQEPLDIMWSNLPSDLLAIVLSFLPPDSLAHAMAACHHWHNCAKHMSTMETWQHHHHQPWFIAFPSHSSSSFVHNPIRNSWHLLNLDFVPNPTRPIATIGGKGLILLKATSSTILQLSICNPFTSQFRHLPILQVARTNPAVGVIEIGPHQFKVYVAGGMSKAATGGAASYEPTLEMYDSRCNNWTVNQSMPIEFAVRLTVWTTNESVFSAGVLYWMTSARAYSIMGFEIATSKWKELSVPMADRLEFAALMARNGKLVVVGGSNGATACIWELQEGGEWNVIEKVPTELGRRFANRQGSWMNTKCVGIEGGVCLYRDIGFGMLVWKRPGDKKGGSVWSWIEGCHSIRGKQLQNFPIKGLFLHPNLSQSSLTITM